MLDDLLASMTMSVRTADGLVTAMVPFRMATPPRAQADAIRRNATAIAAAAQLAGLHEGELGRIQSGRGTAFEINRYAQAVVDVVVRTTATHVTSADGLRAVLFNHGVGIDCAGYVRQAAVAASLLAGPKVDLNDSLSNLPSRGFTRVDDLSTVRPGDIFVLGPAHPGEVGHRAIVYEQHEASAAEIATLKGMWTAPELLAGPLRVFQVDSSWGAGGDPIRGGVQRNTWWYCATTRTWGWLVDNGHAEHRLQLAPAPYGHPLDPPNGVFRSGRAAQ